MGEDQSPDPLKSLDARLRKAQAEHGADAPLAAGASGQPMQGAAMALRIGTELVAALAVGVGLGLLLDHWLGTAPWLMIVFFFLGSAAGVLNVYRTASGIGLAPGYRAPVDGAAGEKEETGRAPTERQSGE